MKGKITEFNDYLTAQVGQPYVWGGQHLKLTPSTYMAIITRKESDAVYRLQAIDFCDTKFAQGAEVLYAYDCSGLGMYWLQNVKGIYKSDMSANSMMGKCEIVTEPKDGYWLFRIGSDGKATHIGYMVGEDVIHAKGRAYGVVRENYAKTKSYWHRIGKPSCMDFDEPTPEPTHKVVKVKRKCRVRAGNGTSYKTLAIAYKGDEYPLIGVDDHDPYWFIIEWKGQQAWITSNSRYADEVAKL